VVRLEALPRVSKPFDMMVQRGLLRTLSQVVESYLINDDGTTGPRFGMDAMGQLQTRDFDGMAGDHCR
jgi:hypothetical protein